MKEIRTVIIDDEPLARRRLRTLLSGDPEIEIVAICADGFQAVTAIRQHLPQLVFLDVQMPEKDGFEVIQDLQQGPLPLIVFVTAFDQYALKAFEVSALDYLLKPFDEERFRKTVERAKRRIREPKSGHDQQILEFIREWKNRPKYLEKFAASSEGRICLLPVERIDYIEASRNYIRIYVGKMSYLIRETVQSIESQLDPSKFLRIHRSVIVNMDRIRELQQTFHGSYRVILTTGRSFNLSRKYKDRLPRIAKRERD